MFNFLPNMDNVMNLCLIMLRDQNFSIEAWRFTNISIKTSTFQQLHCTLRGFFSCIKFSLFGHCSNWADCENGIGIPNFYRRGTAVNPTLFAMLFKLKTFAIVRRMTEQLPHGTQNICLWVKTLLSNSKFSQACSLSPDNSDKHLLIKQFFLKRELGTVTALHPSLPYLEARHWFRDFQ